MTSIESVTLEVPDPTVANAFYTSVFGLGVQLGLRASETPTTGNAKRRTRRGKT